MSLTDLGRFSDGALLVLISLANGQKHGYAIMEDIGTMTGTPMGPGTLYAILPRLEERGWIVALPEAQRRRPYRLTAEGALALREQLANLQALATLGLERLALG